jgi:CheY-like chemotaxis protein
MVDDSEHDAFFVERALKKSGVSTFFHAVEDGLQAISYLRRQGIYSDTDKFPFPNVLLCDLKMPRLDGFGLLEWLQKHTECKVIPTIVFSSSAHETDVHRSYVLGANAYLVKPHASEDLANLLKMTYQFWSACQVPEPPPGDHCL